MYSCHLDAAWRVRQHGDVYFDRRLWALTAGVRGRIAGTVLVGLAAVAAGIARLALLGWLVSWLILHLSLKGRELTLSRWLVVFLVGIGVATTLIWPPVFEYLAGH